MTAIIAQPAYAQVAAGNAPNLATLYPGENVIVRVQQDYTGADVVITAPANVRGVYFKAWGGGGGHEIVSDDAKAGAGGYTGGVFNTTAGTQFTLVVGGGGNRATRPEIAAPSSPLQQGVYGFGGLGFHDQGGGLSGVFTGNAAVTNTSRARALVVAGGGGGSDNDGVGQRSGGTNGNGSLSGYGATPGTLSWNYLAGSSTGRSAGATISGTMQGSNDGITSPADGTGCNSVQLPAAWESSGGGGYQGGGRTRYTFGAVGSGNCGVANAESGRGGSGFVAASNRFQSIEFTAEIAQTNDTAVNVAPRNGTDTDQSNTTGQPRSAVPIGRAGNRSSAFNTNTNGGGDGRIVYYWVVTAPIVANADSVSNVNGGTGATAVLNAYTNDTLNSVAATTAKITGTVLTPATSIGGGPVPALDVATGNVDVPAGTPAGTYTISYQICDKFNTTNCSTSTITVTVAPWANIAITKTNTPGVNGNVDQAADTVTSGSTTTYTLTVTNSGPSSVTGAVVKDTPGAGITCPAGNAVTITGNGVPAGSFTISNLTGAGITLGTLASGQSATLTFTCNVN